jgi:hypothetical protein
MSFQDVYDWLQDFVCLVFIVVLFLWLMKGIAWLIVKTADKMGLLALEEPCPECHGVGVVLNPNNPNWKEWFKNNSELPPFGHPLWRQSECARCGGRGYVPTELGRRLLEFHQRHHAD